MNKKFIKSVATAVAGLTLIASCSMIKGKKDSNKCCANKCSSKKECANKCSSAKKESNKCGAKNGCAAAKPAKK